MTKASIVIPTFGRSVKLGTTLDALLASDTTGLDSVEILVVDDGSPEPVAPIVAERSGADKISVICIRQQNAGPAAARNTGFRAASGEIVLFVDDDVVCPPDLIRKHVDAHAARPGSVIHGRYPYVEPRPMTPVFRYLNRLGYDLGRGTADEFLKVDSVASGQLSVRRAMFDPTKGVYNDDMATPAAEEFDLEARLHRRGIPIYLAPRITASHNHVVSIGMLCAQARKYGRGFAEVSIKNPDALTFRPSLRAVCELNGPLQRSDLPRTRAKKLALRVLATVPALVLVSLIVATLELAWPTSPALPTLYKCLLVSHTYTGFREGLSAYSTPASTAKADQTPPLFMPAGGKQ